MTSYPEHGSSYPHHPNPNIAHSHAHAPPDLQPPIQHEEDNRNASDDLSAHQHHGLPIQPQGYHYDQTAQMLQNAYVNEQMEGPNDDGGQQQQQQQQIQQIQQLQQSPSAPVAAPGPNGTEAEQAQKAVRMRRACDSCSARKVKCDTDGPPCRPCKTLDIPCTDVRPSKRRGPPNKHAEEVKRQKLSDGTPNMVSMSSPTSTNNVAATLAAMSSHAVYNADSLRLPRQVLEALIDDFFTYIHPLCPFPHEPSFRESFSRREDSENPTFLALLASMVGVLVASFPRRPRLHLKSHGVERLFPNSVDLVERCHKVAVESRGAGFLDREHSIYDAATSYFLGLSSAYIFKWKQTRLYFGETLTIIRVLGVHRAKGAGTFTVGSLPIVYGASSDEVMSMPQEVDCIKEEIAKRVFWVVFAGVYSIQQLGTSFGEMFIPPPTPNAPYPDLPAEVDDEFIHRFHVGRQPPGIVSRLTGFNLNIKIFQTMTPLITMELAHGVEFFDWNHQKQLLETCLQSVKQVLDGIPRELMLQPSSKIGEFDSSTSQFYPSSTGYSTFRSDGSDSTPWLRVNPDARRQLQFEIQKANIYASQLGTRSYLVDKYCHLKDASSLQLIDASLRSPGTAGAQNMSPTSAASHQQGETNVAQERENIVKDLLRVLNCISQVNMEPNGGSFINKIRQVASTLLNTPAGLKTPLAIESEGHLSRFLDVLMKLERISPGNSSANRFGVVDEEEELRNWADLRAHQMRFAQAGGFLADM